ncbi:MAG TPA: histidine kinase, partial [Phnomibacter sp.]|nr:histidine kinase [Phnomibacter sp.]
LNEFDQRLVINKITVDPKDRLWLATNKGAILLQEGKPPVVHAFNTENMDGGDVKALLPQGDHVWLTNNRLLARLDPETGKIFYLGEKQGIVNVQLFGSSLTLSPWNTVMIGCNRGFYEIFPEHLDIEEKASPAFLTDLRVNDRSYTTSDIVSDLEHITLKYWQNFFSFSISAFDYMAGNDVEYAYKLHGFDNDWRYLGKNRNVVYTNIPGGRYTLLLKTRRSGGAWNEDGQRIRIDVGTPFWRAWWFRTIMAISILGAIYLWYRQRINRIRKEERAKREIDLRLNDLENSALRTQMSPHFIFNSLNTINSFISRNEPAKANQFISRFAHLIRLILDHSREKKIPLSDELKELELYIELERIRFDNKFNYSIGVDPSIDTDSIEIPPLIIQPFVENAILHGLLPLGHKGSLTISIVQLGETLICSIEDNGIGLKESKLRKASALADRRSHGLEITIKRIELFNNGHGLKQHVSIDDLVDGDGRHSGTKVTIPLAIVERF